MIERETTAAFLERIASEQEAYARDEDGFSDATRAAITADARRLREIGAQAERIGMRSV